MFPATFAILLALDGATQATPKPAPKPIPRLGIPRGETPQDVTRTAAARPMSGVRYAATTTTDPKK